MMQMYFRADRSGVLRPVATGAAVLLSSRSAVAHEASTAWLNPAGLTRVDTALVPDPVPVEG